METLLSELETQFLKRIPLALKKEKFKQPAYALFIAYIDSTTDEHTPYLVVPSVEVREWAVERRGVSASFDIWRPVQELSAVEDAIRHVGFTDRGLNRKIEACYKLMDEAEDAGKEDDDVTLLLFRRMIWRVAQKLNDYDWQKVLPATDDFVVVATDWSGFWAYEDVLKSLPLAKQRMLKAKKLLFHKQTKREDNAAKKLRDDFQKKLANLTVRQQIKFWIDEIRGYIQGADGVLREKKWNEKEALTRLKSFGKKTLPSLLELVVELDSMPHEAKGRPTLSASALGSVFNTIEEIGVADARVEHSLRQLLAESCKRCARAKKWTVTPFRCAYTLSKLFEGYAWPSRNYEDVLTDWEEQIAAPYQFPAE